MVNVVRGFEMKEPIEFYPHATSSVTNDIVKAEFLWMINLAFTNYFWSDNHSLEIFMSDCASTFKLLAKKIKTSK